MSKRWPFPGSRLFHYIDKGYGSSDPATLRRWYRTLDSMVRNSNDKKRLNTGSGLCGWRPTS